MDPNSKSGQKDGGHCGTLPWTGSTSSWKGGSLNLCGTTGMCQRIGLSGRKWITSGRTWTTMEPAASWAQMRPACWTRFSWGGWTCRARPEMESDCESGSKLSSARHTNRPDASQRRTGAAMATKRSLADRGHVTISAIQLLLLLEEGADGCGKLVRERPPSGKGRPPGHETTNGAGNP